MGTDRQGERAAFRRRLIGRSVALRVILTAAVLAAVVLFATRPPPVIRLPAGPPHVARGAFHIHTTRSDGALDKPRVAAAAARAGLQFAVFTDHGDGTAPPDPPTYIDGVLCVDGVEISTNDGHYIALGIPAAPYPLGGDAAAVVEDVNRLGGFGIAAHPGSPRESLAWTDWRPPVDGLEWLNADSEWRDEGWPRLLRTLVHYPWRPAGALAGLFDRPEAVFARWDAATAHRPVIGVAGHDAHGGFGEETDGRAGRRLHVPSYEATFRTFSLYAQLHAPLSGDAAADSGAVLQAIRDGRVFTAIDAVASPAFLEFTALSGGREVPMGGRLPADGDAARLQVRATTPDGSITRLLRNGRAIAESTGGLLEHEAALPGAYRVEVLTPRAPGSPPVPWIVSNPIYRLAETKPAASAHVDAVFPLPIPEGWRAEMSPGAKALVLSAGQSVGLWYELPDGEPASQFAALVTDLKAAPPDATHLLLRARAERPMRVSVQLRFSGGDGRRWRSSIYLEESERDILLPLASLRPADGVGTLPPVTEATSLLLVVDLTNARPGEQGSFAVATAGMGR